MKKTIALLAVAFCFMACSHKNAEMLIGTWKFDDVIFPAIDNNVPALVKIQMEQQYAAIKEEMKKTYTWQFNADGTYLGNYSGTTFKGKWMLSKDENDLYYISDPDGKKDSCHIIEMSDKRWKFTAVNEEGKDKMTTTTFIKP